MPERNGRRHRLRSRRRLPVLLLLLLFFMAGVEVRAQTPGTPFALTISEPRAFGYTLGDSITRELWLRVSAPYQLVSDLLPQPGRADLWLELDPPQLQHRSEADIHYYHITLTYRLINLADPEQVFTIAGTALKISDEMMTRSVPVGEFRFAAHQIVPAVAAASGTFPSLQPLTPPPPLALTEYVIWLIAALVLGLAGSTLLLWIYGLLPWLQRAHGPFARAYRELRTKPDASPQSALRSLHQAFDRAAGETLFRERLDDFFSDKPQFVPLRPSIEAFFAYSRQQFFDPASQVEPVDLHTLARRLRAAERRRA